MTCQHMSCNLSSKHKINLLILHLKEFPVIHLILYTEKIFFIMWWFLVKPSLQQVHAYNGNPSTAEGQLATVKKNVLQHRGQ